MPVQQRVHFEPFSHFKDFSCRVVQGAPPPIYTYPIMLCYVLKPVSLILFFCLSRFHHAYEYFHSNQYM